MSSKAGQSELDRFVRRLMRRSRIPGLSLGVAKNGRPVVSRGFGFRDRERRLPATPSTVYGIASMTKSFTALAILQLEENGRLRVTDPVVRHLPEFRTPSPRWTPRITLHHFLNHSSGLPPLPSGYYASGRSLARDPPYDPRVARRVGIDPRHAPLDTYEEVMGFLATEPYRMLGPPGRYFSYSNEAFGLLGAVIERVSGRTYESYLEEELLRPAGMAHATFDTGIMFRFPEVTTLYAPRRTGKRPRLVASQEWWEDTCLRACGGLRTNIDDLLSYIEIYRTGGRVGRERIVSAQSVRKMLRPTIPVQHGVYYGYGIAVRPDYHGTLLAFHNGGLKGVSSEFAVLPKKGVGGAVLANVEGAPSPLVLRAALNQQIGLPLHEPFFDLPPPSSPPRSVREFGGWYCSGEGIWAQVTPRTDSLQLDFRGIELTAKGLRLRPHGNDRFVLVRQGQRGLVEFARDAHGRVWAASFGWRLLRRRRRAELGKAPKGRMIW
ncbi:MAG TPA: serine hydrolase domain-containing protein [Thermoplasmata archaeon]|nr:serine hydrolase domain-containing protein [Thermoplasmata archaeon]